MYQKGECILFIFVLLTFLSFISYLLMLIVVITFLSMFSRSLMRIVLINFNYIKPNEKGVKKDYNILGLSLILLIASLTIYQIFFTNVEKVNWPIILCLSFAFAYSAFKEFFLLYTNNKFIRPVEFLQKKSIVRPMKNINKENSDDVNLLNVNDDKYHKISVKYRNIRRHRQTRKIGVKR